MTDTIRSDRDSNVVGREWPERGQIRPIRHGARLETRKFLPFAPV